MLSVLLMVAFIPLAAAPAAVAESNAECQPFTRSDLFPPEPAETTTTLAIDLVSSGQARGGDGIEDTELPLELITGQPPVSKPPSNCTPFAYEMEFPLLGGGSYSSGFGAARDGGRRAHMGIDIMAPQMTPVVAVADGIVVRVERDRGTAGSYVMIEHDDDWSSWYLHLNNDRFGTDDGLGAGVRPGLEVGTRVEAGALIGWVGDSGNAETTAPHLHFEVHLPSGEPIDAYASLIAAEAIGASAFASDPTQPLISDASATSVDLVASRFEAAAPRPDFSGPFVDDDGTDGETAFNIITALGVPTWCDEWGVRVCPDAPISGGDAEAWISAASGSDRDPSVAIAYEGQQLDPGLDRSSIVACGISTFCSDGPATFGEIAAMMIGATDGVSVLSPTDASVQLVASGMAGCGGPQDVSNQLTRAEMAGMLLWTLSPDAASCDETSSELVDGAVS